MTVESATYLNDLSSSYPAAGDVKSEGDDHIRLIKAVLKNTFPGYAGKAWRAVIKSGAGPHTLTANDNASIVECGHTTTTVLNLPSPGTVGNGWCAVIYNYGTGTYTLTPPSGNINGVANYSLVMYDAVFVFCGGTNYIAFPMFYLRKNADQLDGMVQTADKINNTIARRDANGDTAFRRVTVGGSGGGDGLVMYDRNLGGSNWHIFRNNGNMVWYNSTTTDDEMILDPNGNLYLDGDVIGFYSDERLKKDVQNLKYRAQDVWHMRPVRFKWNDHRLAKEEGKEALGFIAQEVQQWCPEAVEEREDPRTPGEKYLWVNYEMLVPVAFQIIKDLENQLRGFERFRLPRVERLAELEARVEELERQLKEKGNASD